MRKSKAIVMRGLTLVAVLTFSACSDSGETMAPVTATITLVSGGNQMVSLAASPGARLPEPIIVHVARNGVPAASASVRAYIRMDGAPGANGAYYFSTGTDGDASIVMSASPFAAGFSVTIEHIECGWFVSCETAKPRATVSTRGSVVP